MCCVHGIKQLILSIDFAMNEQVQNSLNAIIQNADGEPFTCPMISAIHSFVQQHPNPRPVGESPRIPVAW